ncbi:MAG: hypothetical protein M3Y64_00540 [Gemmatimonadota bacterium]|nr:hypothetical protein [Gemmatimonadota bacterium]
MTAPVTPFVSWEALGRNAAPLLEHVNAVVIAGRDSAAAASFALGIARVLGSVRRVAIADLVGEAPPLQALVTGEDGHGISDSFLYGVSLNKIARPLEGSANVFLMPSGTEAVATEEVYRNERWRKLAAGFHQVGALLLVVAKPETIGFGDLCEFVGAVFPIGDYVPTVPAGVQRIALPQRKPPEVERVVAKARAAGSEDTGSRQRKYAAAAFATVAIALLVGILWPQIADRLPNSIARLLPGRTAAAPADAPGKSDSTKQGGAAAAAGARATDSANADSVSGMTTTARGGLAVANPADSTSSAAYAVYLVTANTSEGTLHGTRIQGLPAVAVSPIGGDSLRWFRLTVGAVETEAAANALLARLRTAKVLGPTSGSIIRVPYAFRLAEKLPPDSSAGAIANFQKLGIFAYALKQSNGTVSIFTGAAESVAQASFLADSLRAQRVPAVLVYRTGRTF